MSEPSGTQSAARAARRLTTATVTALRLGVAFLLLALSSRLTAAAEPDAFCDLRRLPNRVVAIAESGTVDLTPVSRGVWRGGDITVTTRVRREGVVVEVVAPGTALKALQLCWRGALEPNWKYLGDAWERAYGELEWKPLDAGRVMPW